MHELSVRHGVLLTYSRTVRVLSMIVCADLLAEELRSSKFDLATQE